MTAAAAGALLPDPVYLLIPFGATLGGLINACLARLSDPHPDWARAWVIGNVCGSGLMSLIVTILWALGVSS